MTVHLSPNEVFLAVDVQFKPNLQTSELVQAVDELEEQIHQEEEGVGRIFIEIEGLRDHAN